MFILNDDKLKHVKIVSVGNPYQLPPVGDEVFYSSPYFQTLVKHKLTFNHSARNSELKNLVGLFYNITISADQRLQQLLEFINSNLTKEFYN